jgi:excisionase family DNA binding protein
LRLLAVVASSVAVPSCATRTIVRMSHTDVAPRLLTINDVAQLLGVSQRTVQRWVSDGRLPAIQLGGRRAPVRVDAAGLRQWLEEEGAP